MTRDLDEVAHAATEVGSTPRGEQTLGEDEDGSPTPAAPSAGLTSQTSRYQLGKEIARGGMGRVLEATDRVLQREVAIKEALSRDEALLRRFTRETRITARLEHPSIVPVYDAGQLSSGAPFYAMRRISGRPFDQLIREASTVGARLALLPNLLAVAQAVAHAHSRGVIHRDLKPNNVLIGELGETIVIDWGLAKVVDEVDAAPNASNGLLDGPEPEMTRAGMVVGTPGYMAPEQIQGDVVDARTDVYALGATLYFLLTRQPPHRGKTADTVLDAALTSAPTPIRDLAPGVPAELIAIADKALARDPAMRYGDATRFAEDLKSFLAGQLVAAHRYSPRERVVRFLRRNRLVLAVIAGALAVLSTMGALSVSRVVSERDRATRALAESEERNVRLVIEQARALVASNPTLAVAMVKDFAASHWREVRAIGMAARAAGIAYGLPASPSTIGLAMLPGGRVASSGNDGVLRVHDLATARTRVITTFSSAMRIVAARDGATLVAWGEQRIQVIDLATGTQRTLDAPPRLASVCIAGDRTWLRSDDGLVWSFETARGTPVQLDLRDQVHEVACGPRDAVLAGHRGVWLSNGHASPNLVTETNASHLAWHRDGTQLGLITQTATIAIIDVASHGIVRTETIDQPRSLAWLGDDLFVGAEGRLVRLAADGSSRPQWLGEGPLDSLLPARGDLLLAHARWGSFTVIHTHSRINLPPTSRIDLLASSTDGSFAVGASEGVLLVWDLAALMPQQLDISGVDEFDVVPGEQLVFTGLDGTSSWFDLKTGVRTPMQALEAPMLVAAAPDGKHVLLRTRPGWQTTLHGRGSPAATPVPGHIDHAKFISNERFAVVTDGGEVQLHDVTTGDSRVLERGPAVARNQGAVATTRNGGWFAVLRSDQSIWRYHLATDRAERLPAGNGERVYAMLSSGDIVVGEGTRLRLWATDGALRDYVVLPKPVLRIADLDGDERILLGTSDVGALVVTLDAAREIIDRFPPGSTMLDLVIWSGFAAWHDSGGRVYVSDLTTPLTWRLATPYEDLFDKTRFSSDGRVLAIAGGRISSWSLQIPQTADETSQFLDRLTNARVRPGTSRLIWEDAHR